MLEVKHDEDEEDEADEEADAEAARSRDEGEPDPLLFALVSTAAQWAAPFVFGHLHKLVAETKIEAGIAAAQHVGVDDATYRRITVRDNHVCVFLRIVGEENGCVWFVKVTKNAEDAHREGEMGAALRRHEVPHVACSEFHWSCAELKLGSTPLPRFFFNAIKWIPGAMPVRKALQLRLLTDVDLVEGMLQILSIWEIADPRFAKTLSLDGSFITFIHGDLQGEQIVVQAGAVPKSWFLIDFGHGSFKERTVSGVYSEIEPSKSLSEAVPELVAILRAAFIHLISAKSLRRSLGDLVRKFVANRLMSVSELRGAIAALVH